MAIIKTDLCQTKYDYYCVVTFLKLYIMRSAWQCHNFIFHRRDALDKHYRKHIRQTEQSIAADLPGHRPPPRLAILDDQS